jgi:chloramphenicol 3-O-phosphotransferase
VRLLDGMYRAAVAMARAGNNVVVEDVVWEPMVATMARHVLAEVDPLVVRLVCPSSVAIDRERARPDRFVGGVAAYATAPEIVTDVDLSFDSSLRDPHQIAAGIRAAIDSRGTRPTSANNGR